ncbi:peptidoglycan/xylan/chitin deacetylase (PgdA/CDA1 family) [Salsuginibacillus halophilus]|uniref:Peptidoglycan/xylan/chitin deacetylase (PgdA/CDA1 family) n=1 Tax=Salsuginibacillus halophilus TaxID=517424 RepID=A0A2P8H9T2_9BACI|nr:polysaccharide deacetylase family protein [Salsuginibacillus halophilus]PSL42978.1 peptidoglycan/xylan/chitin deacetylase (PgdA/CDA1 family) [Salsuginibacillus halophilus]
MVQHQVVYDLQDPRWIKNKEQVTPAGGQVILTFDDGPSRQLPRILDVLQEKGVPAIFFWQSRLLYEGRPWRRVLAEGHQIGAHTHRHRNLVKLDKKEQERQIKLNVETVARVTGEEVRYFRPPFGRYNEDTLEVLKSFNLLPVMWEISSFDWEPEKTPDDIICNVCDHLQDGSIILLHELKNTVAALPELIDEIRAQGYEFVGGLEH